MPVPRQPDHYRILGVAPSSDQEAIRRAYRALAKRYHPDAVPADHREWAREQMARINDAYQVLGDPGRRAQYDLEQGYRHAGEPPVPAHAMRTHSQTLHYAQGFGSGQARSPWRKGRARERSRRQRMERWRSVALISAVALLAGLVATAALIRTPGGYVLSALVNGGSLVVLLVSLAMANR